MISLGFGCMRLPVLSNGEIDIECFSRMVDYAIEHNCRYFDTAIGYHKGNSEIAVSQALVQRYPREEYRLATKMAPWKHFIRSKEDAQQMFYTSMGKLQVDYLDTYLFQNMGKERTEAFDRFHLWDFIKDLKERSLIREFGISFHDRADALEIVLDKHPEIEFVQLQINFVDWEDPIVEARRCLQIANNHHKPVIVMEPVKGGSLVKLPARVQKELADSKVRQSNVEWALRFAASRPGVKLVLSGMSALDQLQDNIRIFQQMEERPWSEQEEVSINHVQDVLKSLPHIPCTGCEYCTEECPAHVKIPQIIQARNIEMLYNDAPMSKHFYFSNVHTEGKASLCLGCGQCEEICPQKLPIRELLQEAVARYGE